MTLLSTIVRPGAPWTLVVRSSALRTAVGSAPPRATAPGSTAPSANATSAPAIGSSRDPVMASHLRPPGWPVRSTDDTCSDDLPTNRQIPPTLLDALSLVVRRLPPEDRVLLRGWRLPFSRRGSAGGSPSCSSRDAAERSRLKALPSPGSRARLLVQSSENHTRKGKPSQVDARALGQVSPAAGGDPGEGIGAVA